jgi:hypothetical protein
VARLLARRRHIADGMHRQGFDLQLTQYDDLRWHGKLADERDRHRVRLPMLYDDSSSLREANYGTREGFRRRPVPGSIITSRRRSRNALAEV